MRAASKVVLDVLNGTLVMVSLAVPPALTVYDPEVMVAMVLADNFNTVRVNALVSVTEPLVIVAVSVTVASPEAYAGRLIVCPLLETTEVLFETQVMVEPFVPDDGKVAKAKVI